MYLRLALLVVCIAGILVGTAAQAEDPLQYASGYYGHENDPGTLLVWHMDEAPVNQGDPEPQECLNATNPSDDFRLILGDSTDVETVDPLRLDAQFLRGLEYDAASSSRSGLSIYDGMGFPLTVMDFGIAPFTVETWIKPSISQSGYTGIFDNAPSWIFRYASSPNSLQALLWFGNYTVIVDSPANVLIPGIWQHVAMTSGGAGGSVKLWVNGRVVAEQAIPSDVYSQTNKSVRLAIGANKGGGYYYTGAIDEVRVSDAERTFDALPVQTGNILGRVTRLGDSSPIAGATVSAAGTRVITDGQGDYIIPLAAGNYDVCAEIGGFTSVTITGVQVTESQDTSGVDFSLTMTPPESPAQWYYGYSNTQYDTVSLWHMDEVSGDSVDAVGSNSFDHSADPTHEVGIFVSAMPFNGTSDWASSTDPRFNMSNGGFTAEMWIKPSGTQSSNVGLVDNAGAWLLRYGAAPDSLQVMCWCGGNTYVVEAPSGTITPNVWQHVALTYGGDNDRTLRVYVNGVVVAQQAIVGYPNQSVGNVVFGANASGGYNWAGLMDEVRISSVARQFSTTPTLIGGVSGTVTDGVGNPVVNASVSATGRSEKAVSGDYGEYLLWVPEGTHEISVSKPGYATGTQTGVSVSAGSVNSGINFVLGPAPPESSGQWMDGYYSDQDVHTVGLWHLDENSGTIAYDVTGMTSLMVGNASWSTGKFNSGLAYSTGSSAANFTANRFNFGVGPFTAECWINPTGPMAPYAGLLDNAPNWLFRGGGAANSLSGMIALAQGVITVESPAGVIEPGVWQHVAMTYAGGTGPLRIIVNGVRVAETLCGFDPTAPLQASTVIAIGANKSGGYQFNGSIDDIRISDVARNIGLPVSAPVGELKSLPDYTSVSLANKQVTRVFDSQGFFYIEEPDRTSGIRVVTTKQVAMYDLIAIDGVLATNSDGERIIIAREADITVTGHSADPIKSLGSSARGIATGVDLTGLLVKIWGTVSFTDPVLTYFYIDDGSGINDGSGNPGIRINALTGFAVPPPPSEGTFVIVEGILSKIGGEPVVLPLFDFDIQ